ncbi:MAG: cell surface protein, partial [Verrucomicrobiales bacterium]
SEPTLDQALQLLNGQEVHRRVGQGVVKFDGLEPAEFIDALYLAAFSRHPRDGERATAEAYLAKTDNRTEAIKDLVWAILNTQEFMFQH